MDELKSLIEILGETPDLIIWLVFFYFFFKIVVVGSIYATIRYVVGRVTGIWIDRPYNAGILAGDIVISSAKEEFLMQLKRLKNRGINTGSEYVHRNDIDWLREAIDDKIAKDKEEGKQ